MQEGSKRSIATSSSLPYFKSKPELYKAKVRDSVELECKVQNLGKSIDRMISIVKYIYNVQRERHFLGVGAIKRSFPLLLTCGRQFLTRGRFRLLAKRLLKTAIFMYTSNVHVQLSIWSLHF